MSKPSPPTLLIVNRTYFMATTDMVVYSTCADIVFTIFVCATYMYVRMYTYFVSRPMSLKYWYLIGSTPHKDTYVKSGWLRKTYVYLFTLMLITVMLLLNKGSGIINCCTVN